MPCVGEEFESVGGEYQNVVCDCRNVHESLSVGAHNPDPLLLWPSTSPSFPLVNSKLNMQIRSNQEREHHWSRQPCNEGAALRPSARQIADPSSRQIADPTDHPLPSASCAAKRCVFTTGTRRPFGWSVRQ